MTQIKQVRKKALMCLMYGGNPSSWEKRLISQWCTKRMRMSSGAYGAVNLGVFASIKEVCK